MQFVWFVLSAAFFPFPTFPFQVFFVSLCGKVYHEYACEPDVTRTYEKIGVRYHFGKRGGLFAGLDLRAHQFDRSYALVWSLGYGF